MGKIIENILQEDNILCFLGLISTYQEQFGQQRIECGRSVLRGSRAGWSDFTPVLNKYLDVHGS